MKRTLFFVINQDPTDESAHSLYVTRHLASLGRTCPPGCGVTLVCPSKSRSEEIASRHQLDNVTVTTLPSLRRRHGGFGLHINAVFHHAAWRFLRTHAGSHDVVATASFPALFEFLGSRFRRQPKRPRLVYEIHQLERLSRPADHPKCRRELAALACADGLLVTTIPLEKIAHGLFPATPISRTGLAASYRAVRPRTRSDDGAFRIGYFGSISPEQGVPWLVSNWPYVRAVHKNLELHIYGRARRGETLPLALPVNGLFVHSTVPSDEVPQRCEELDALVIPALDQGHRSAIAFTKVYDDVGLALPLIASDLPTIREVVRDDVEALLFAPGDTAAFSEQLGRLIANPLLAKNLHAACIERAASLTWDARAARWWEAVMP